MALDTGSQELLDAQAHIYNHMFSFINSMSLRCAIELGIPDAIHKHGQPMTLSKLADVLHINKAKADGLYHLMRILIHSKFFDKVQTSEDEEAYALPRATRLFLIDEPMNTAPLALLESDPILLSSWLHVSEWFRNEDASSFVTKHGRTIWENAGVDQRFNKLFNESMASDSRVMDSIFVKECKQVFQGLTSMEDVGGGIGETAKGITHAFPELRCIVLDLPHVVAGLEGSENISFVSGDMLFDSIPHADAVFFKWVLHILSDKDCVGVLKKSKEAISESKNNNGGKVIIVEIVLEDQKDDERATQTQLYFDIQMLVQLNAKERTEKEWANIFLQAGFHNYNITRLSGFRSIIEVFP